MKGGRTAGRNAPTLSSASLRSERMLVGSAPELEAAFKPSIRVSHASRRACAPRLPRQTSQTVSLDSELETERRVRQACGEFIRVDVSCHFAEKTTCW